MEENQPYGTSIDYNKYNVVLMFGDSSTIPDGFYLMTDEQANALACSDPSFTWQSFEQEFVANFLKTENIKPLTPEQYESLDLSPDWGELEED